MNVDAIKDWMKDRGYSQYALAADLDIAQSTVSQVIRGKYKSNRVVSWFLERGCPAEYVAPSKYNKIRMRKTKRIKRECDSATAGAFRSPYCDGIHLMPDERPIESWAYTIPEDGYYTLIYHGQVVNNEAAPGHNVVVWVRLYLNGVRVVDDGWNVTPAMHYKDFTLPWGGWFAAGDRLELMMAADSDAGFVEGSANLMTCQGCGYFMVIRAPMVECAEVKP